MTEVVNTTRPARRFTAGLAACLLATVGVLALAWPDRDAESIAIDYRLADERILAARLSAAPAQYAGRGSRAPYSDASVRRHLEALARTGDSRYLRYAKMSLQDTRADLPMTFDRAMLDARIQQAEHEFLAAADTLRQALGIRPNSAEGWLLLSDSLRRAGHTADARAACLQLAFIGEAELATWCGIQVLHSTGEVHRAYSVQQELVESVELLPAGSRTWALAIAADTAAYVGDNDEAYRLYSKALSLGDSTLALRLAFADFLIAAGREGEVADILASDHGTTAALLRVAIAEVRNDGSARTSAADAVQASLQLAAATNDPLRFRDRALWALEFHGDASAAHDLALANWTTQKGYEDLILLRDAARAAGREDTLAMLEGWLEMAARGDRS